MKTAEDILRDKGNAIHSVQSDITIQQAVEKMVEWKIGAVLVQKGDDYVGLWTERDLLRDVCIPGFDIKTALIGDYMTKKVHTASQEASIYELMDKFLGLHVRQLVIENNGVYMGLISVGDVMKSMINDKTEELKNLNAIINWEYYENWQWKRP